MWTCAVDTSPTCVWLQVQAGHEGVSNSSVSHSSLFTQVAALLSRRFKCPAICPWGEHKFEHLAAPILLCCKYRGGANLGAQIAQEKNCYSVNMAHQSRQMQVLIFFFVTSSFHPDLLPFSITYFVFCWHTRILLLKGRKLNCFLDESVICLPQNGKFNHTNDYKWLWRLILHFPDDVT